MLEVRSMARERTLLEWYDEYRHGNIEMKPKYQRRGGLWRRKNKQLLINSILNRYDIPKIYLSDFTYVNTQLNESNKPYAVVDGKQRLETFFEFFEDNLRLDNTVVYTNDRTPVTLEGASFSDLRREYPKLALQVEEYLPTVMSVISDRDEDIQDLFVRLNLTVPVSGPERRNAMPGPLPILIRELAEHEFFKTRIKFSVERGQDLNTAARMLMMEYKKGYVTAKKRDLDQFVEDHQDEPLSEFEAAARDVETNLTRMTQIFRERDSLLRVQAQIPIYYWLVRKYGERYPNLIRPFLQQFEKRRSVVRGQLRASGRGEQVEITDQRMVAYNNRLRTPDDKSNLQAMFAEIERRFQHHIEESVKP